MASPAENPKTVRGDASRHTCKASPVSHNLDRPNFSAPTAHHTGNRRPHAVHHLRNCFRTNVPQYRPPTRIRKGDRRYG
jgi:hypothetical protein